MRSVFPLLFLSLSFMGCASASGARGASDQAAPEPTTEPSDGPRAPFGAPSDTGESNPSEAPGSTPKQCTMPTPGSTPQERVAVSASSGARGGPVADPASGAVLTADGMTSITWTAEETKKEIAVRTVRTTETASYHVIRLAGAEKPHRHLASDLTVTVLRGGVRMHLGDQVVVVSSGQVIDVPRGTPHYAENIDGGPSEAYVVFSPPFSPSDNHPIVGPN